jgi:sec-independent protein translocase protein TatB
VFGLTIEKIAVIAVIAAILLGPERMADAARLLGRTARRARQMTDDYKTRLEVEAGIGADDWKRLDPRQYDPRRIIAAALIDDPPRPQTPAPDPGGPNERHPRTTSESL